MSNSKGNLILCFAGPEKHGVKLCSVFVSLLASYSDTHLLYAVEIPGYCVEKKSGGQLGQLGFD